MRKNLIFGLLSILVAGFGFGGISMAADANEGIACKIAEDGGLVHDDNDELSFVAYIGDGDEDLTCYIKLTTAFENAQTLYVIHLNSDLGQYTITDIKDDCEDDNTECIDNKISIDKEIILDLNGITLRDGTTNGAFVISAGGKLTVNDSDEGDEGSIEFDGLSEGDGNVEGEQNIFTVKSGGTLELSGIGVGDGSKEKLVKVEEGGFVTLRNVTCDSDTITNEDLNYDENIELEEQEDGTYKAVDKSVASVNNTKHSTLQAAINGANSGDTVTLLRDIDLSEQVVINKSITLDLQGHKLYNTNYIWNTNSDLWSLISVQGSIDVTITGNGTLQALINDEYAVDLREGAKVTIENGTFVGNMHAVYVYEGELTIEGGTYSVQQKFSAEQPDQFVINLWDTNRKNTTAKATIKGGTYSKFDPSDCEAEGIYTNFLAKGYYSIYDGEEYYEVGTKIGELTSFYMSSNYNNAEFNVVLNDDGDSIDLWQTRAYLNNTLTIEQKEKSNLYQLLKDSDSTNGIEVLEAAGEKLLFVNNTKENRTDVFRSSTTGKFNGDVFLPSKASSEGLESLVYGDAIKPTWVTNVTPDKYIAINDGEPVIGYTLHTADNGWFYAPKAYTVTFVDEDGTTVLHTQTVALGTTPVFDGSTPTKASDSSYTYTFKEWSPALAEVTDDATYKAVFTSTKKPSTSSGGGGSSRTTTTTNNTGSTVDTGANATPTSSSSTSTTNNNSSDDEEITLGGEVSENNANASDVEKYGQEFVDAYNFAFKNGITTMPSIEEADMNAPLTRIAMAKMLSQYAINVLGKTADTTKVVPTFPDVSEQLNKDYNDGVTLAYQLGIMGINIEKFRPYDLVTRAEFGTALSRMLYSLSDGEGDEWYKTHLDKLMTEEIITVDTPNLQELRGYVMIMLMRSVEK